jgi:hypothetical protein
MASSVFMVTVPPEPWGSATDWAVVGLYLAIYAVVITLVARWSSRSGWDDRHRLALAGGALLTYAWHAFPSAPIVGATGAIDLVGNAVFAAGAVALLAAAVRGRRAAPPP